MADPPSPTATGPRPRRRPWHATTALDRFALVTWAVEPGRLAARLPTGFEPLTAEVAGEEVALVSAVPFLDRDFHFRGVPWIGLSCGQVNHRAYVRRHGEDGVWFVGTSLDSWLVAVPRRLWAMPWHRERVRVDATWADDGDLVELHVDVAGAWGAMDVRLGPGDEAEVPDVLRSPLLTDPLVGWYPRRRRGVGRYTVWHEPLDLQPATVVTARAAPFIHLGVLDPDRPPLGALVTPTTTFDVHTPPRTVRPDR